MTRLARWIDRIREIGIPRALPVLAYAGADPAQARSAALDAVARALGADASFILANDLMALLAAAVMATLIVTARFGHAPQL